MLKCNIYLFCTIDIYYFFFFFRSRRALGWTEKRKKKGKKILISSEINRSLCPAKLKPTHHHQSSTSHVIVQKTVFSFNPYNELSFPTFNLRYETQPRPSIWLEFSRISAAHSPLPTMPIPIATDINSRCEQYFRFSTRIATFDDFAISMNHLRIFPIFVLSQRDRNESPNFSPIKFFLVYPPLLRLRMIKEKKGTKMGYYMPINTMSSLRRIRCITVAQSRKRVSMQFHEYVTTRNYEYLDDSSSDSSTRYFFLLFLSYPN